MRFKQFLREVYVDDRNDMDTASDGAFETSLSAKLLIKELKYLRDIEISGNNIYATFFTGDAAKLELQPDGDWTIGWLPSYDRSTWLTPLDGVGLDAAIAWLNSELDNNHDRQLRSKKDLNDRVEKMKQK